MYIASFYINIEKAKEVYKHIQDVLHINPHVRKEYEKINNITRKVTTVEV
jgi:hypothetical protein